MAQTKKYLDLDGLSTLLEALKGSGYKGYKLVSTELITKLSGILSVEEMTALKSKVAELDALVTADTDGVINKFNEIVAFLAGISDQTTLQGTLSGIASQIAEVKDIAEAAQPMEAGKGLSSNDYTDDDKAKLTAMYSKADADSTFVKSAELVAITDAEITELMAAE